MRLSTKQLSDLFDEVKDLLSKIAEHSTIKLPSGEVEPLKGVSFASNPIDIKTSPHTRLATIFGVMHTMDDKIVLHDGKKWWELTMEDKNVAWVITTIAQRLRGML